MNANELLAIARKSKPHVKYVRNDRSTVIGAWSDKAQEYIPVAALDLLGQWREVPGQLFINGKPMVPAEKWIIE